MSPHARVVIHPASFRKRAPDLLESLRTRQVNHKFHYDSIKQTQQWLALHQTYSPSRTDADCAAAYDRSFAAVAARIEASRAYLIGLGCGGGQKTHGCSGCFGRRARRLSTRLRMSARQWFSWPGRAPAELPAEKCFPLVCDLATADDLPSVLGEFAPADAARLISFLACCRTSSRQSSCRGWRPCAARGPCALQRQSRARRRLRERRATYPAALRQHPDARVANEFLLDLGVAAVMANSALSSRTNPAGSGLKRIAAISASGTGGKSGWTRTGSTFPPASQFAFSFPGGTRPRSWSVARSAWFESARPLDHHVPRRRRVSGGPRRVAGLSPDLRVWLCL